MISQPSPPAQSSLRWADHLGVWTSALCVIHCVFAPVLLSISATFAHLLPGDEKIHRRLAVLVALFGVIALIAGFRKHQRKIVILLMLGGMACIAGAAWFGDELPSHAYEVAITLTGSCLMIAAHRLNHTFCKSCECASGC
jgi:peptidoglycan/LPS O-acetylase OafA/YrhL